MIKKKGIDQIVAWMIAFVLTGAIFAGLYSLTLHIEKKEKAEEDKALTEDSHIPNFEKAATSPSAEVLEENAKESDQANLEGKNAENKPHLEKEKDAPPSEMKQEPTETETNPENPPE